MTDAADGAKWTLSATLILPHGCITPISRICASAGPNPALRDHTGSLPPNTLTEVTES
jgi:hypothetical protein